MNERIQELMNKAMVKTGDLSRRDDTELDPEKFAQLVIMECTKFLDEQSDRDDFVTKVAPLLRKN